MTRYFQDNTALIGRLNHSLKSHYLQDVERRDVFDRHSEAYQVYGALTRLEQMASMNEVYRKENNVAGLQEINRVLKACRRPVKNEAGTAGWQSLCMD
ncbi:hypothetical protein [Klebsiella quasipneumoniae]|uniref:hypothetical protein n=1 Tax=Klebsiella quasipneumoniae TaxID=1463165 RepID=UPI0021153A3D|nr:hypothetical protein [Klebsiella quasipneumoniae]